MRANGSDSTPCSQLEVCSAVLPWLPARHHFYSWNAYLMCTVGLVGVAADGREHVSLHNNIVLRSSARLSSNADGRE